MKVFKVKDCPFLKNFSLRKGSRNTMGLKIGVGEVQVIFRKFLNFFIFLTILEHPQKVFTHKGLKKQRKRPRKWQFFT